MSHSSTSGILKALAELGEGASHGIDYLLQQVGTLPLAAAFEPSRSIMISFFRDRFNSVYVLRRLSHLSCGASSPHCPPQKKKRKLAPPVRATRPADIFPAPSGTSLHATRLMSEVRNFFTSGMSRRKGRSSALISSWTALSCKCICITFFDVRPECGMRRQRVVL